MNLEFKYKLLHSLLSIQTNESEVFQWKAYHTGVLWVTYKSNGVSYAKYSSFCERSSFWEGANWHMLRKRDVCCVSKHFIRFKPEAASLKLAVSVPNTKKWFYARKLQFFFLVLHCLILQMQGRQSDNFSVFDSIETLSLNHQIVILQQ